MELNFYVDMDKPITSSIVNDCNKWSHYENRDNRFWPYGATPCTDFA